VLWSLRADTAVLPWGNCATPVPVPGLETASPALQDPLFVRDWRIADAVEGIRGVWSLSSDRLVPPSLAFCPSGLKGELPTVGLPLLVPTLSGLLDGVSLRNESPEP
jgi:hypothetical protein